VSPPEVATPTMERPRWRLSGPPREVSVVVLLFAALAVLAAVLVGDLAGTDARFARRSASTFPTRPTASERFTAPSSSPSA
jgi:hypothetical protein